MSLPSFSEIAKYRTELPGLSRATAAHDLIGRHGPVAPVLRRHLGRLERGKPFSLLDIGAYDRAFGNAIVRAGFSCHYQSLDTDNAVAHDYNDLKDVRGPYNAITMFELIEHLSSDEVDQLLHRTYGLLAPGGILMISTPNPFHPTRYFSDASHKQHWPAHDLYGFLRHVGFAGKNIKMYGVIYRGHSSIKRAPGMFLEYFRYAAWRLIGLETCGGILAVATK